jgi:peptide chain release factor 3
VLQLGDTLTEGEVPLQFTGRLFAPEMFRAVEVADPLRSKQLRRADAAGEEGAIQVFRPIAGSLLLLGAVGQLQFEVVAHRLEHEYGVKARIMQQLQPGAWVTSDDANELNSWMPTSTGVALDAVDAPIAGGPQRHAARRWSSNGRKSCSAARARGLVFQAKCSVSGRLRRQHKRGAKHIL